MSALQQQDHQQRASQQVGYPPQEQVVRLNPLHQENQQLFPDRSSQSRPSNPTDQFLYHHSPGQRWLFPLQELPRMEARFRE